MVTKSSKSSSSSTKSPKAGIPGLDNLPLPGAVKDSAQQIWQAGLGAFTRAQAEGSKAFESLVKEGMAIQKKTQGMAEEKIAEAASRVTAMAGGFTARATGHMDKLEGIFEERVAKALNKLGVPSAKDVSALIDRIEALNASVQALSQQAGKAPAAAKKATPKKPSVNKAPAKKASARKSAA
jgi:poly(hydroxyalkanoate) granule-associated protein